MAVDVMQVSTGDSFAKMAFGQSGASEELQEATIPPEDPLESGSSSSSVRSSLLDLSLCAESGSLAVDQLNSTRRQLELEIDVSVVSTLVVEYFTIYYKIKMQHLVGEITRIGEDMNCTTECDQLIQDRYVG